MRSLGFAESHYVNLKRGAHTRLVVSPLATLAFKLVVVGYSGLKTGGGLGTAQGGAGRGWVGWG